MKFNFKKDKNIQGDHKWIIVLLAIFLLIGATGITSVFMYDARYQDKIYPGTRVGDLDLGGMDYEQAKVALNDEINKLIDYGFAFSYNNQKFIVDSTVSDVANPELASQLASFDVEATIENIRIATNQQNEAEHIYHRIVGWQATPVFAIDQVGFIEALDEEIGQYEQPAIDASLVINEDETVEITVEKSGQAFNYDQILNSIILSLANLSEEAIVVKLEVDYPEITKVSAESMTGLVGQVLDSSPFILNYDEFAWKLSREQVRDWLELQINVNGITLGLNPEKADEYFTEMAGIINIEVKEAKFAIANDRVTEFQFSQDGRTLMVAASLENISSKITQIGISDIDLVVEEVKPEETTANINDLGITELVAEGQTNYAGSPKNRRFNIELAAEKLNGTLIAPGETYSLVKALSPIDSAAGYLSELVIKGNRTIPEVGGGLCQIGTTFFRLVLDSGLPVVARRNHSYRVSYYEPPVGMDATIYDPNPDFSFTNDYPGYLLLQTEVSGSDLIFRFYGTSDGRVATSSEPRIYNITKPAPTKLIETTDLAPGQKKCIESAHNGADADFTYSVTYPDGNVVSEVFKSHYKPWQEVCLIGVEKLSEEPTES